jgi:hypothetical protein
MKGWGWQTFVHISIGKSKTITDKRCGKGKYIDCVGGCQKANLRWSQRPHARSGNHRQSFISRSPHRQRSWSATDEKICGSDMRKGQAVGLELTITPLAHGVF